MKIIISPAKKINKNNAVLNQKMKFDFINQTKILIENLKSKSENDLKKLMSLSDNLAQLNWLRYQDWDLSNYNTCFAIKMFDGDVYKGLDVDSFNDSELNFAQEHIRILSGLYGVLKPLDKVLPYRLEMGTKLEIQGLSNLYAFWGNELHDHLLLAMKKNEKLINLASNEYSKVLSLNKIKERVITPVFKDYKNGKLKVISFFAKRARGEMCNFIVKNKLKNINDLKLFNNLGYQFHGEKDNQILFVR